MGMIHVAVFSICFCIVVGFELNIRECGTNDITTNPGKIAGGTEVTSIARWPWACSLGSLKGSYWMHRCGGSLITYRHLVTAAHCIHEILKDSQFQVRCGDLHLSNSTDDGTAQTREVVNHSYYKDYNLKVVNNDIAVISVGEEFNPTAYVRPICLTRDDTSTTLITVGWGFDKKERFGQNLKQSNQQMLEPKFCKDQTGMHKWIDLSGFGNDLFCAADPTGEQSGSCKGDSGGPIFSFNSRTNTYFLRGIVNGGIGCGKFSTPDIYTSTTFSPIYEWILDVVEDDCVESSVGEIFEIKDKRN